MDLNDPYGLNKHLFKTTLEQMLQFADPTKLQGRDLSYGSRRNALQAISFLGFLAWVVAEVRGVPTRAG